MVFGALRDCVFTAKGVKEKVKGKCYTAFVLSVLLYGSECWALRRAEEIKLVRFHNRCLRTMCRVNRRTQFVWHIRSADLEKRLGLSSMEHYIAARVLRWAGHVVRMEQHRLPRKLLFSWVEAPRKSGGQEMTLGTRLKRTIEETMKAVDGNIRRIVTGSAIEGGRRAGTGVGWVGVAKRRDDWAAFVAKATVKFREPKSKKKTKKTT